MKQIKSVNREDWLNNAVQLMASELFNKPMPKYRVSCSFPTRGAVALKRRTLGQCFDPSLTEANVSELIVSMVIDNKLDVLAVLAHEMVHAYVGTDAGHGPKFRALALAIGLTGKMTATVPGDKFKEFVATTGEQLGEYPHTAMNISGVKKQTTRMIKAECPECGYTVRLSRKWAEYGLPICPVDNVGMLPG